MTQIELHPSDSKTATSVGTSVAERLRLAKSWDETLKGIRVIERQDNAGSQRQGSEPKLTRTLMHASSSSSLAKILLNTVDRRDTFDLALKPNTAAAGQNRLSYESTSTSGGSVMAFALRELGEGGDTAEELPELAQRSSQRLYTDDASEPVIKLLRNEEGITVLIVHPRLVSPADISQFVAEVRQSALSMPVRVRSIRLNGQEVYSDARRDGAAGVSVGPKPSHVVNVKF